MAQVKNRDILETFSGSFPLLQKVYSVYEKAPEISNDQENTLRRSMEETTLEILELIVVASRQPLEIKKETLRTAMRKIDTLKVFADCAAQTGLISKEAFDDQIANIGSMGAMVGGWYKAIKDQKKENV